MSPLFSDAPPPQPPDKDEQEREERRRLYRLGTMGLQFALTVVVFYYIGYRLDLRFGWGNKATITLTLLGTIGSMYLLIKEALKSNK